MTVEELASRLRSLVAEVQRDEPERRKPSIHGPMSWYLARAEDLLIDMRVSLQAEARYSATAMRLACERNEERAMRLDCEKRNAELRAEIDRLRTAQPK